jgi:hypothetical protein
MGDCISLNQLMFTFRFYVCVNLCTCVCVCEQSMNLRSWREGRDFLGWIHFPQSGKENRQDEDTGNNGVWEDNGKWSVRTIWSPDRATLSNQRWKGQWGKFKQWYLHMTSPWQWAMPSAMAWVLIVSPKPHSPKAWSPSGATGRWWNP